MRFYFRLWYNAEKVVYKYGFSSKINDADGLVEIYRATNEIKIIKLCSLEKTNQKILVECNKLIAAKFPKRKMFAYY